jgi:hypothetical protein
MGGVVSTQIARTIDRREMLSTCVHQNRRSGSAIQMKVAVAAVHESLVGTKLMYLLP